MPRNSIRHLLLRAEEAAYRYLELTETTMEVLIAAGVGLLAGAIGISLRAVVGELEQWRHTFHATTWLWTLFPLGAAGLLCLLYLWMRRGLAGYTFPDYLVNVNLKGGAISSKTIPARLLATILSVGGGASVGLEGPAASLGGAVGSVTGRALRASRAQCQTFVACGTAAGVAALFNAPLAGVFFALEIVLLGAFDLSGIILVVIAAGSGVAVARGMMVKEPLFAVQKFAVDSVGGLLLFALLGLVIGIGAVAFIRGFHGVRVLAERIPVPWPLRLLIGGCGLALMGLLQPGLLGTGEEITRAVLRPEALEWTALGLLAIALGKILIAGWSLGVGFSGGMFGPCMFTGAALGASMGLFLEYIAPGWVPPGSVPHYALVGMGAMLAAVNHAPLTGIFLLFEITDAYQVILPIMFASVIATWLTRLVEPDSLDTYALSRRGIELHGGKESLHLRAIPIEKVLTKDIVTAPPGAPLDALRRILAETPQFIVPVVDNERRLVGTVVADDLTAYWSEPELGMVLIAKDVMRVTVAPARAGENLGQVSQRLNRSHLSRLPVVDADERLIGIVTRDDVRAAYDKSILLGVLESLSPRKEPS